MADLHHGDQVTELLQFLLGRLETVDFLSERRVVRNAATLTGSGTGAVSSSSPRPAFLLGVSVVFISVPVLCAVVGAVSVILAL